MRDRLYRDDELHTNETGEAIVGDTGMSPVVWCSGSGDAAGGNIDSCTFRCGMIIVAMA